MGRPRFEELWRKRFTERGLTLDDDAGIAGWSESGLETRLRHFRRLWTGARPGSLWFDIGCGAGSYSRTLAAEGLEVVGVDYSQPSIAKARSRSPEVAGWIVGDATRLPIRTGSADGILCFGVLQALSGSDRALAEMAGALKPGGALWVDALNAHCLPHRITMLLRRPTRLRYETANGIVKTLHAHGLEATVHWVPIMPARLHRLQSLFESAWVRWLLRSVPPLGALLSHSILVIAAKPCRTTD